MRFLVDKCLGRSIAGILRELGHEAVHGSDQAVTKRSDDDVSEYARQNGYIVITLDKRFHADSGHKYANSPGLIVLDPGSFANPRRIKPILEAFLVFATEDFCRDSLLTLSDSGLRKVRQAGRRTPSRSVDVDPWPSDLLP